MRSLLNSVSIHPGQTAFDAYPRVDQVEGELAGHVVDRCLGRAVAQEVRLGDHARSRAGEHHRGGVLALEAGQGSLHGHEHPGDVDSHRAFEAFDRLLADRGGKQDARVRVDDVDSVVRLGDLGERLARAVGVGDVDHHRVCALALGDERCRD